MICPLCSHGNYPGAGRCARCLQDLTRHDRPAPEDRVGRSLMDDAVRALACRFPVTMPAGGTVGEALHQMTERNIGAVLVVDQAGSLVGVFTERDALMKVATVADYASRPVTEFMTRRPETVRRDDTLAFVLHRMDCGGYRHVPVLDEGRLAGVASVRDLLGHIARLCEEASAPGVLP